MKAAVLREVGKPLEIEDVQIDKPGPHEVLIRTAAAGVCHSDLHFIQGDYPTALPTVLGHESAGWSRRWAPRSAPSGPATTSSPA